MSTTAVAARKMFTFRLLASEHMEPVRDENGEVVRDPVTGTIKSVVYQAGDKIITPTDLAKKFNAPGFPPKFKRVADDDDDWVGAPPTSKESNDAFEEMSSNELRKFAEENELDLKGARSKPDMIAVLRSQLS